MSTYSEIAKKPDSEKVTVAHMRAREKVKIFLSAGSNIYTKKVDYFIENVHNGTTQLVKASTSLLSDGDWYFDIKLALLFLRMPDLSAPVTNKIILTYLFFLSDAPEILPWDLLSGEEVEYQPRIKTTGNLKLDLDFENTGIAIETDSNISLENTDGYFDEVFDTLVWENQECSFWSYLPEAGIAEKRLIYNGLVIDKVFKEAAVQFKMKDQIFKLRDIYSLPLFSSLDGDIDSTIDGKPKRIIFGKVKQLRVAGTDRVLDGYRIAGTISGNTDRNLLSGTMSILAGQTILNGVGTLFLSQVNPDDSIRFLVGLTEYTLKVLSITNNTQLVLDDPSPVTFTDLEGRNLSVLNNIIEGIGTDFINECSPGDEIFVDINLVRYSYRIDTIIDATELVISDEVELAFNAQDCRVNPAVPYRKKNRKFNVSGHKLREFNATIIAISDPVNFEVDDIGDIEPNDILTIGNGSYVVIRKTLNKIRINQALALTVAISDTVTRVPIRRVFLADKELVFSRDFSYANSPTGCDIILSNLAEFNISRPINTSVPFVFTNGSNVVVSLSTSIDLTTLFAPRMWVMSKDITHVVWYEILSVEQTQMIIRENYSGPNFTGAGQKKDPSFIDDDTLVTTDCLGIESNNKWIKNPAQVIRYILESLGFTNLDNDYFDQAEADCNFTMSYFLPDSIGGRVSPVREIISDVNKSVFGSLYLGADFLYRYSILNADRDENLQSIKDEDIVDSPTVTTRNQIVNKVTLSYRPYTDILTETDILKSVDEQAEYTDEMIGIKNTLEVTSFIYEDEDAQTIAERWAFFRSMTQAIVSVKAKLQFFDFSLNDQVFLDLDRLYRRYGGRDRKKIGIINSITKSGDATSVSFNDMGNIFNRVAAFAPDSQDEYANADRDQIAKFGFIVDNDTETPDADSELEYGNNLIG